jgi:hypothetical protein
MNRDSGNGHRAALSQETKEQEAAVEKARAWSYHHAARLGVSVEEIGAATLSGWTAEDVEALPASEADRLTGPAAYDPELAATIKRIKSIPARPIRTTSGNRHRSRLAPHYEQPEPSKSTAMADAFKQATE